MKKILLTVVLLLISSTAVYSEGWHGNPGRYWYCEDQSHGSDEQMCKNSDYACCPKGRAVAIVYDGRERFYAFNDEGYVVGGDDGFDYEYQALAALNGGNSQGPGSNIQTTISSSSNVIYSRYTGPFRIDVSTPSNTETPTEGIFNILGTEEKVPVTFLRSDGKYESAQIYDSEKHLFKAKYDSTSQAIEIGGTRIITEGIDTSDSIIKVPKSLGRAIASLRLDSSFGSIVSGVQDYGYEMFYVKYNSTDIMPIYLKNVIRTDVQPNIKKIALLPIFIYKINGAYTEIRPGQQTFVVNGDKQLNSEFGIEFDSMDEILNYLQINFLEIETNAGGHIAPAIDGNSAVKVFYLDNGEFKYKDSFDMDEKLYCYRFASNFFFTKELNIIKLDASRTTGIPEMKYFSNGQKEIDKVITNIKSGVKVILTQVIPVILAFEIVILLTLLCLLGVRQLTLILGKYFDLYKIFTFGYLDYSRVTAMNLGQFTIFIFIILVLYTVIVNLIYY